MITRRWREWCSSRRRTAPAGSGNSPALFTLPLLSSPQLVRKSKYMYSSIVLTFFTEYHISGFNWTSTSLHLWRKIKATYEQYSWLLWLFVRIYRFSPSTFSIKILIHTQNSELDFCSCSFFLSILLCSEFRGSQNSNFIHFGVLVYSIFDQHCSVSYMTRVHISRILSSTCSLLLVLLFSCIFFFFSLKLDFFLVFQKNVSLW